MSTAQTATPAAPGTPAVAPLSRATVYGLLLVGLLSVSVSSVLAAFIIGDTADGRLGVSIAFWRCAGGAAALAPFAMRARSSYPVAREDARRLVAAGVFLALHFALFLGSLAYTSVASSATLATMAGVFVAVGGIRYLGERPDSRTWLGIAITMVGAIGIGAGDLINLEIGGLALAGDAMAFLSAILVAGYLLIARKVRSRVHTATFSTVVYASAALLLLVVCLAIGAPLVTFTSGQWLGLIGMIVFPQLLGHNIFTTLLSSVPASVVGVVVLAEPVIATLLAWWLLTQAPTIWFFLSAPVVLIGLIVATARRASAEALAA
jgi:drug/metabolite transporter (DMT)-like permease